MTQIINQPYSEYKRPRSHFALGAYIAITTKPEHQLQMCPIVHNQGATLTILQSYICVLAAVKECGEGQKHKHTDGYCHNTFRLAMPNAKRN